jgi:hypothetical protein
MLSPTPRPRRLALPDTVTVGSGSGLSKSLRCWLVLAGVLLCLRCIAHEHQVEGLAFSFLLNMNNLVQNLSKLIAHGVFGDVMFCVEVLQKPLHKTSPALSKKSWRKGPGELFVRCRGYQTHSPPPPPSYSYMRPCRLSHSASRMSPLPFRILHSASRIPPLALCLSHCGGGKLPVVLAPRGQISN